MSLSYSLPAGAFGMLVLSFCDHRNNQFVDLDAWSFTTEDDLRSAWASVPEAGCDTSFSLDRHTAEGLVDDRAVSAEWIESRCGRPIAELIDVGRQTLSRWVADQKAASARSPARARA